MRKGERKRERERERVRGRDRQINVERKGTLYFGRGRCKNNFIDLSFLFQGLLFRDCLKPFVIIVVSVA